MSEFLGEATEYDNKVAVERRKVRSWLKSVSAFANTKGGRLIFGVADDGTIVGLNDFQADSEFISQKIKERISPIPELAMDIKIINGNRIIIVSIAAGTETPYYYVGDGSTEAYIRVGNESVIANSTDLKRLVLRGKNSSYDSIVAPYNYDDFAFTKWQDIKNGQEIACLKKICYPLVSKIIMVIFLMQEYYWQMKHL